MKERIVIILGICVFITFLVKSCISDGNKRSHTESYCGFVTDKGYDSPTSGYKSNRDGLYYFMFFDTQRLKTIRVNVVVPTYNEFKIGENVCFDLSNLDLYNYGNTTNPEKNLNGK